MFTFPILSWLVALGKYFCLAEDPHPTLSSVLVIVIAVFRKYVEVSALLVSCVTFPKSSPVALARCGSRWCVTSAVASPAPLLCRFVTAVPGRCHFWPKVGFASLRPAVAVAETVARLYGNVLTIVLLCHPDVTDRLFPWLVFLCYSSWI